MSFLCVSFVLGYDVTCVRIDRGYELTWVRVDRGYETTWVRVDLGYELTVNQKCHCHKVCVCTPNDQTSTIYIIQFNDAYSSNSEFI